MSPRLTTLLLVSGLAGCFSGELVSTSPDAPGRVAFDGGTRGPDAPRGAAGSGGKGDDPVPPPTTCPYNGPAVVNPSTLFGCLPGAHCQSDSAVAAPMQSHLQRCADGMSFCVPDEYIKAGGQFIPPSCVIDGGEGRCLSLAFRESRDAPQASCAADHACVPCFRGGQPTGLCSLSCDQPATGAGGTSGGGGAGGASGGGGAGGAGGGGGAGGAGGAGELARCCSGRGSCVAAAGVLGGRPDLLGRDICSQDLLCEPDSFRTAAGPQRCIVGQGALTGQIPDTSGACVPSCVPLVGGVSSVLSGLGIDPQGSCAIAEVCVPCTNPLDGQPTGACRP